MIDAVVNMETPVPKEKIKVVAEQALDLLGTNLKVTMKSANDNGLSPLSDNEEDACANLPTVNLENGKKPGAEFETFVAEDGKH